MIDLGDLRRYTETELEQFERDQRDSKWLEWVAPEQMQSQLRKFFAETVPNMPEDPWSPEGLDRAEHAALSIFPTVQAVTAPESRDVADRFHRFIGEVFRRNFEGIWCNVPSYDDPERRRGFGPVIARPFAEFYLAVIPALTTAIDRQQGTIWSQSFRYSKEDHEAWINGGRLPLAEWIEVQNR
ncbi:hypothetical protein ACFYTQ_03505 [Nocardia sp. NPDC004068]|uniref:hypothetical protein n=1 Tax=Nocardia sp. NPDC004068 TaxID=3364303 RepID=UPI00367E0C4C